MITPTATLLTGYDPQAGLLLTLVLSTEAIGALLSGGACAIRLAEADLPRGAIVLAAAGPDVEARCRALMAGEAARVAATCAAGDVALDKRAYRCPREACGYRLTAVPTGRTVGAFVIVHGPARDLRAVSERRRGARRSRRRPAAGAQGLMADDGRANHACPTPGAGAGVRYNRTESEAMSAIPSLHFSIFNGEHGLVYRCLDCEAEL